MSGNSKRKFVFIMGLSLFFLSAVYFISPTFAVEQVPVGTRPMGMGETYVAIANDGNAVHLNPAGISLIQRYILNGAHADLLGTSPFNFSGLEQNYVSVVLPVTKNFATGIDWMNIGISDGELGFTQNKFNFALSLNLRDMIAMGMNGKYVSVYTGLDGMDIDTASGFGLDSGILFFPRFLPKVGDKLKVGLMLQDFAGNHTKSIVGGTSIRHDFAGLLLEETADKAEIHYYETVLPLHCKFGVAYDIIKNPQRHWLVSADFDDRFHFGSEFWLHPMTAIRAGVQIDKEGVTYSLGGTLKYINNKLFENSWFELNYAYVLPPTLPATSYFSLSTSFDFQRSPITIEKVLIRPGISAAHHNSYVGVSPHGLKIEDCRLKIKNNLQSSIKNLQSKEGVVEEYKPYEGDTAGRIWLHNKSKKDMDVKVTLAIEDYVPPTDIIEFFTIGGKKTISLPLSLPFSDDIMTLARNENVTARIKVLAVEKDSDKRYFTSQDEVFMLHNKNTIVWDDLRRLGSFITADTVEPFARETLESREELLREYAKQLPKNILSENILQAILLFEALVEKGIIYIKDANSPSYVSYMPDTVRYPQQLLSGEISSADCDDFTALYCAMLESVGIHTALIGLNDHILMAFDTGISWQTAQDITLFDYISIVQIPPVEKGGEGGFLKNVRWYVEPPIDGKAYIPIETTMLGKTGAEGGSRNLIPSTSDFPLSTSDFRGSFNLFVQAWQNALNQIQEAEKSGDKIECETVANAWEIYKPAYTSPKNGIRN